GPVVVPGRGQVGPLGDVLPVGVDGDVRAVPLAAAAAVAGRVAVGIGGVGPGDADLREPVVTLGNIVEDHAALDRGGAASLLHRAGRAVEGTGGRSREWDRGEGPATAGEGVLARPLGGLARV